MSEGRRKKGDAKAASNWPKRRRKEESLEGDKTSMSEGQRKKGDAKASNGPKRRRKEESLVDLVTQLLSTETAEKAQSFLMGVRRENRKELAKLAGLSVAWVNCDQRIEGNVKDMCSSIITELWVPKAFYEKSLQTHNSLVLFSNSVATVPLKKSRGFWEASGIVAKQPRMKDVDANSTFEACVHFIQAGSDTGVALPPRYVLTCAHVVAAEDDGDGVVKGRMGRRKLVMFPSGRVFMARCVAVRETEDGEEDAALLELEEEIGETGPTLPPPVAALASKGAEPGDRLFAIGNPSSVDLESVEGGEVEFEPPTWHPSVGSCVGDADEGYVGHSCWTYWGHSGAPLFNESGEVVSLHCSWNDETGLRRGQRHEVLKDVLSVVAEAAMRIKK